MHCYIAYNTGILCNRPIPELISSAGHFFQNNAINVQVVGAAVKHRGTPQLIYTSATKTDTGDALFHIYEDNAYLIFDYFGNTRYLINRLTQDITIQVNNFDQKARGTLINSIFAVVLELRGIQCQHGCVVCLDNDMAIMFIGPSGAGKSTMALNFVNNGHAFLTDDIAVLKIISSRRTTILPAYPAIRLICASKTTTTSDTKNKVITQRSKGKEVISFKQGMGSRFCTTPAELKSIFILSRDSSEIQFEKIDDPGRKLGILATNSLPLPLLNKLGLAQGKLKALAIPAATLPMQILHYPDDITRQEEVRQAILNTIPL